MDARMREPGPDHPITITRPGVRVVVRSGTTVIADSTRTLALAESTYPVVHYVPIEDVDRALLVGTATATYCPFKGDASYWTVVAGDDDSVREIVDAVWTYREPYPAVAAIAVHVAFYADRVTVEEIHDGG